MSDVTRMLRQIDEGDHFAAEQLIPLVYAELRQIAAAQIANEKPGQTLDPTGLVHEAYLRLVGDQQFENRRHFFGAAAEAMRRILVERARSRRTLKAGGERIRVNLESDSYVAPERDNELLELDAALERLAIVEPDAAQIVQLRYFEGCTMQESAELMGMSLRSVHRLWAYSRAWLLQELRPS